MGGAVVVWGNCQAAPVADLLRAPLRALGLEVVDLPPIYLLSRAEVAEVHALMARTAVLVAQPIRDGYRVPGCSTQRLTELLPTNGRLITFPLVHYSGTLPYQVTANGTDGERVPAPLTEYHDLRLLLAAHRQRSAADVLASWPERAADDALRVHAARSLAELRQRESSCHVAVSDLVLEPAAMFTINHPRNAVLAEVARRILTALVGDPGTVTTPEREYLGGVRTPLEGAGGSLGTAWTIAGESVPWDVVITEHLAWYRTRPDVVADGLARNAGRVAELGLA